MMIFFSGKKSWVCCRSTHSAPSRGPDAIQTMTGRLDKQMDLVTLKGLEEASLLVSS